MIIKAKPDHKKYIVDQIINRVGFDDFKIRLFPFYQFFMSITSVIKLKIYLLMRNRGKTGNIIQNRIFYSNKKIEIFNL